MFFFHYFIKVSKLDKENWQNLIYDPYIPGSEKSLKTINQIFQIIDNEENWNIRLDNLNKNNLGLTGLAGLGLGLLRSEVLTDDGRSVMECSELRAQSTGQKSTVPEENIIK